MDCIKVKLQLQELLDGVLEPAGRRRIQDHLKSCASCSGHYRGLSALARSLGSLPLYAPGPGFNQKVLAGLTPTPRRVLSPAGAAWALGFLLLLVGGGWTLLLGTAAFRGGLPGVLHSFTPFFHPAQLRILLSLAEAKSFQALVHLAALGKGLWLLWGPGNLNWIRGLQVLCSSLGGAFLALGFSGNTHLFGKRGTA